MKNYGLKGTLSADQQSVTNFKDWTTPASLKNGWRASLHHPVCRVVAKWDREAEKAKKAGYAFARELYFNLGGRPENVNLMETINYA